MPPTYLLQTLGSGEARGPEEATLTSALRSGARDARRLGLITQEKWHRYHRSGEAAGTPLAGPQETSTRLKSTSRFVQTPQSAFL